MLWCVSILTRTKSSPRWPENAMRTRSKSWLTPSKCCAAKPCWTRSVKPTATSRMIQRLGPGKSQSELNGRAPNSRGWKLIRSRRSPACRLAEQVRHRIRVVGEQRQLLRPRGIEPVLLLDQVSEGEHPQADRDRVVLVFARHVDVRAAIRQLPHE